MAKNRQSPVPDARVMPEIDDNLRIRGAIPARPRGASPITFVARNIDEVLAQLTAVIETSKARRSRLGYFAALYRQVTLEVKRGIDTGLFDDGPRMDRFDTAFGNRYFAALAAWESGHEPPKCWRVAFDLLTNEDAIILQHLLLGVNAHINLDLSVAAVAAAPGAHIGELSRDYNLINDILVSVLTKVQDAMNDVSPYMWLLDELGGRSDERALDFSIRTARAEVSMDRNAEVKLRPPEHDGRGK